MYKNLNCYIVYLILQFSLLIPAISSASSEKEHSLCRSMLLAQAKGCWDCGPLSFVNSLPWLLDDLSGDELRIVYKWLIAKRPEILIAGIPMGDLKLLIEPIANFLSVKVSVRKLGDFNSSSLGILFLSANPSSIGHFVTLIDVKKINENLYEIQYVDPLNPLKLYKTELSLESVETGVLADEPHEFFLVDGYYISLDKDSKE